MRVVIPAAYVFTKPEKPNHIGFRYPREFAASVNELLLKMKIRKSEQLRIEISLVRRPRSTGKMSQNNHVWGHCQNIADQLVDRLGNFRYTAREIEQAMLRMAVSEGYPTKMSIDGHEEPVSFSQATVEQAKLLIDVIHRFSDEHELWVIEVDPETKKEYRSIGGRTYKEMQEYGTFKTI